jgi:diadenosine tetraphosphate (Ap4A) HIT family hydrolase
MLNNCQWCLPAKTPILLIGQHCHIALVEKTPFNPGQLQIVLNHHQSLSAISAVVASEILHFTLLAKQALTDCLAPDGYNIYATSSPTDHFCQQIIPRWKRDIDFATTIGQLRPNTGLSSERRQQLQQALVRLNR